MPRLTIVTANLNHGAFLGEAISSAMAQEGVVAEHLLIDGGSTDQSHAIVAQWPRVRMMVRPDMESHGAINHGLALAQGEFIGFLNADDRYEPNSLAGVIAAFDAAPQCHAICCGIRFFRTTEGIEQEVRRFDHLPGADLLLETTFGAPGFNSWFFRTSSLRQMGGLRTEWRIAADRDLLMRLLAWTAPRSFPHLVYHYRVHDGSRTMTPRKTLRSGMAREHIRLARLHAAGCWRALPGGTRLLREWRALEGLRLLVGLRRGGRLNDIADILTTPWMYLPAALQRRRQWLSAATR